MLKLIALNALRNINRNRLRAAFSIFIIGSMVLFFTVLHTVSGMLTKQFSHAVMQYDIVIQSRYANSPLSSHIDSDLYEKIKAEKQLRNINAISISRFNKDGNRIWIIGVNDFAFFASKFGVLIQRGNLFNPQRPEIIIGNQAVRIFRCGVGDKATLNNTEKFNITGIFSSIFTPLNSAVIMSLDLAKRLNPSSEYINLVLANVGALQDVDLAIKILQQKYPELLLIKAEQVGRSMTTLRDITRITTIISWLVFITAAVAILNTLLITTIQRTREIGILAAIGWPKPMIAAIFLAESMLLSAVATTCGLAFSKPLLWLIRNHTSLSIYVPDSIAIDVIYKVMAMSFFIGLVGIAAPMSLIFKLNISDALRHE